MIRNYIVPDKPIEVTRSRKDKVWDAPGQIQQNGTIVHLLSAIIYSGNISRGLS